MTDVAEANELLSQSATFGAMTEATKLDWDIIAAHNKVFSASLTDRVIELTIRPGKDLVRGANGIAEGISADLQELDLPKFRQGGLHIVHCGGGAGLFSAIIGGWVNGDMGSTPVCIEITP